MICGKTIYPKLRDAINALKGMMKKFPDRASLVEPSKAYFCDDCNGYHLYSESKNKAKRFVTKQSKPQETNSESEGKKENDRKHKVLIIHEPRKFKVK
jgi:hypothetical protein